MDARPEPKNSDRRASFSFSWRYLRDNEIDHELIWLSTSIGSLAVGAMWLKLGKPLPPCVFHTITGWPCPACGCTRATFKLLQGDLLAAFAFNPLYVTALAAAIAFNLYAVVVLIKRLPRLRLTAVSPDASSFLRRTVFAVILCNWAWLIYRGV